MVKKPIIPSDACDQIGTEQFPFEKIVAKIIKVLQEIDMSDKKITNLADPSNEKDAVNLRKLLFYVHLLIRSTALMNILKNGSFSIWETNIKPWSWLINPNATYRQITLTPDNYGDSKAIEIINDINNLPLLEQNISLNKGLYLLFFEYSATDDFQIKIGDQTVQVQASQNITRFMVFFDIQNPIETRLQIISNANIIILDKMLLVEAHPGLVPVLVTYPKFGCFSPHPLDFGYGPIIEDNAWTNTAAKIESGKIVTDPTGQAVIYFYNQYTKPPTLVLTPIQSDPDVIPFAVIKQITNAQATIYTFDYRVMPVSCSVNYFVIGI